ncbi:uncharacterized protein BDW47DRAFT_102954 [Aspergillus candidus]|uniref:Uncharacterized protein n=1 Tax=Aspergillus candidus TaxID=41067 RepID=A0A2I2FGI0_ASPCN|nr:hypothetical protein BDW47DRAFT_102954 [Aspergillus candidus]PLB39710.1 hypothetical protein BDW47DRAFT_102954 [Aspergillus candidus]
MPAPSGQSSTASSTTTARLRPCRLLLGPMHLGLNRMGLSRGHPRDQHQQDGAG